MIHVIAQIRVNPGTRDAFLDEFRKIVPLVLAEDGCLAYGPTIDAETDIDNQHRDENVVTIVEQWESVEHLKAHLVAPHMLDYRPNVKDYVASAQLNVLQPA